MTASLQAAADESKAVSPLRSATALQDPAVGSEAPHRFLSISPIKRCWKSGFEAGLSRRFH
jgi:hypothetical protein